MISRITHEEQLIPSPHNILIPDSRRVLTSIPHPRTKKGPIPISYNISIPDSRTVLTSIPHPRIKKGPVPYPSTHIPPYTDIEYAARAFTRNIFFLIVYYTFFIRTSLIRKNMTNQSLRNALKQETVLVHWYSPTALSLYLYDVNVQYLLLIVNKTCTIYEAVSGENVLRSRYTIIFDDHWQ